MPPSLRPRALVLTDGSRPKMRDTVERLRECHVKIASGTVKDGLFIPAEKASLSRA